MYSHSTSKACCEIRLFLLRFILHLVSLCKNCQNLYSLTHSVPCLCSRPNVVFLFHYFISQEFESKLVASESLKEELIIRLKNTETNVEALKTADQGKKKKQGKLQTLFKFTCNSSHFCTCCWLLLLFLSVSSNDLNHYSNLTEQNWRPDLMPAIWRARTHE